MTSTGMASTHRVVLPLCLGLALLPGRRPGVSWATGARQVEIGVARAAAERRQCAGPTRGGASAAVATRLGQSGFELLRAGRVDDAIAFFDLNVGGVARLK